MSAHETSVLSMLNGHRTVLRWTDAASSEVTLGRRHSSAAFEFVALPPVPVSYITTEAGDRFLTEAGDLWTTEP